MDLPEASSRHTTRVEPAVGPPLLVRIPGRPAEDDVECLRRAALRAGQDGSPLIVRGDVEVYQLVDGLWRPLDDRGGEALLVEPGPGTS
jgi:hypothetical protein